MLFYKYIRKFVNSNSVVRSALQKTRDLNGRRRIEYFQQHGYEVNTRVYEALKDTNYQYFALAGTLLGLVREGGFIPYDDDLDYGILIEDNQSWMAFRDYMINHGFRLKHYYSEGAETITEMSFMCNKVSVDFFGMKQQGDKLLSGAYYRKKDKEYEQNEVSIMHVTYPLVKELRTVRYHGSTFYIPDNYEGFLEANYGENWRTPIKGVGIETRNGTRTYLNDELAQIHVIR